MSTVATVATTVALVTMANGSWWIARTLTHRLQLPACAPLSLAFAITVGGFITMVGLFGRLFSSFDAGLVAAAVFGLLIFLYGRRLPETDPLPRLAGRVKWLFYAVVAGLFALYARIAFFYQMHDEHAVFGHKSMVEQFRRGVYPLYFPPLPGEEARYHYGFDILAGAFTRGFNFSSDFAIDLVCLLLVLFMCWAAAAVALDCGAKRSVPLAVLAIHFGSGLSFLMLAGVEGRHPRCLAQYHHPTCEVDLFPTQFLNVFQHPVSVGVPLLLVFLLLAPRIAGIIGAETIRTPKKFWLTATVSVLVIAGLSMGQFVYFALGCLAALCALPVWLLQRALRSPDKTAPWIAGPVGLLLVLGLSFLLAHLMGGMLAPNESIDPELVKRREIWGFPPEKSYFDMFWYHLANLGIGLLLLPLFAVVSLVSKRPAVVLLVAFAAGGVLVPQLYTYERSWDIVKFPSAASFALSMLYVVVLDRFLAARPFPFGWVRRAGAVLLMGTGITAAAYVLYPLPGTLRLYEQGTYQVDPLIERTITWWLDRGYQSEELIYAQSNVAKQLAVFGGLSVVAQDSDLYYIGIDLKELVRQRNLSRRIQRSMDAPALKALGVHWVMLSDEETKNLGPRARRALTDPTGPLELMKDFPADPLQRRRRIWRVRASDRPPQRP